VSSTTDIARRLYAAMADRDPQAILESMSDDFVGQVSAGMPLGVGGRHEGRDAMLTEVWGPVFGAYDVRLEVERYLECGDEVVVLGRYRGTPRSGGDEFAARFAHVLKVGPGGVRSLEQVTDTGSWG
jgi:ketosteroid isomerase-like protein